jgi:hypothetical protein
MDIHIERLVSACRLAYFDYRTWSAPELVIQPPVIVEVPAAAERLAEAASPAVAAMADAAPVAAPMVAAPAVAAPVVLAPMVAAPAFVARPAMPEGRPPVVLPPPDAAPAFAPQFRPGYAAEAPPPRLPAGRPPVVLPPPDSFDPIIAFRGIASRRSAPAAQPRTTSIGAAASRRANPGAAAPAAATPPPGTPPRRFALLDEIMPPAGRRDGDGGRSPPRPTGPQGS